MNLHSSIHQNSCPEGQCNTNSNPFDNVLSSIIPRQGRLIPLRTKAEVEHSSPHIIQAYIVEVPQKSANDILKAIDAVINAHTTSPPNLQHLRRIIKPSHLPTHLQHPIPSADLRKSPTLHLLVCPTASIPVLTLNTSLAAILPAHPPSVFVCDIPLYPPTSQQQAKEWSEKYWPAVWRKYNPFGPQPSEIEKAEEGLMRCLVGRMMGLAVEMGRGVEEMGCGVGVGVVVADGMGRVIIGAGDGRWGNDERFGCHYRREDDGGMEGGSNAGKGNGNPMAHAVMRAIGMVARKRRDLATSQAQHTRNNPPPFPSPTISQETAPLFPSHQDPGSESEMQGKPKPNHFIDHPLTPLEQHIYTHSPLEPGGYLCLDLDIYLSHEPCVMCSMAILHSRFSKLIFARRMLRTGGMSAEGEDHESGEDGGNNDDDDSNESNTDGMNMNDKEEKITSGYGLFYRPELNWRMLAWRWEEEDMDVYPDLHRDTHI
ncbi:MAG: hypothetical protein Q9178_002540 [Gyalolechia marmorata]